MEQEEQPPESKKEDETARIYPLKDVFLMLLSWLVVKEEVHRPERNALKDDLEEQNLLLLIDFLQAKDNYGPHQLKEEDQVYDDGPCDPPALSCVVVGRCDEDLREDELEERYNVDGSRRCVIG